MGALLPTAQRGPMAAFTPNRLALVLVIGVVLTMTACSANWNSPPGRERGASSSGRVGRMLWGSGSEPDLFKVYPHLNGTAAVQHLQPTVVGWTTKAGPSLSTDWALNESYSRLDSFMSWRLKKQLDDAKGLRPKSFVETGGLQCKDAVHPPTNYPGCQIYVNHRYKYIYIRAPKSASTSIVNALGECGNNKSRNAYHPSCMRHSWEKDLKPGELEKIWNDYFVFGFVRNPWRRAFSLYKYIHTTACLHWDNRTSADCQIPWGEFCANPWMGVESIMDKGCIKKRAQYIYFHMMDQFHCFRTKEGGLAVDFIGRVEHSNEDYATVVNEINKRRDPEVPELPVEELEEMNIVGGKVHTDPYAQPGAEHCVDAVSRWYACDIDRFGYLPRAKVAEGREGQDWAEMMSGIQQHEDRN